MYRSKKVEAKQRKKVLCYEAKRLMRNSEKKSRDLASDLSLYDEKHFMRTNHYKFIKPKDIRLKNAGNLNT
jgi:hypothetical protein